MVWDAWRREDGRWSLTAGFAAGGHEGLAELTYDQPGNFVLLDNDEARWLVGDVASTRRRRAATSPSRAAGRLRGRPRRGDRAARAAGRRARHPTPSTSVDDEPADRGLPRRAGHRGDGHRPRTDRGRDADPRREPPAPPGEEEAARSVPSWDEIMFGGAE